jgi:7-cyano-7-deazaguanine synthase
VKTLDERRALLVFSGGQDSTTCLFWALEHYQTVETVSFDYGQRHLRELKAARKLAEKAQVPWRCLSLKSLGDLGSNALVDVSQELSEKRGADELPSTFVPGRNLLFLTLAASLAYQQNCRHLITGVCQTDYSGYPDCRQETMTLLEKTLQKGMDCDLEIKTPLMFLSKAETVRLAEKLGILELLADTHTCYDGKNPPCGCCDACRLRAKGFQEAGVVDPLLSRK